MRASTKAAISSVCIVQHARVRSIPVDSMTIYVATKYQYSNKG